LRDYSSARRNPGIPSRPGLWEASPERKELEAYKGDCVGGSLWRSSPGYKRTKTHTWPVKKAWERKYFSALREKPDEEPGGVSKGESPKGRARGITRQTKRKEVQGKQPGGRAGWIIEKGYREFPKRIAKEKG